MPSFSAFKATASHFWHNSLEKLLSPLNPWYGLKATHYFVSLERKKGRFFYSAKK
jgi:hypothetical protein